MWTTDKFSGLGQRDTVVAYRKLGIDLVSFIVGAARNKLPDGVTVPMPPKQRQAALDYYDAIVRGQEEEEKAELQNLLFSLFTQPLVGEENPGDFPSYRFLVFYAFREDGAMDICNNITQVISKMVFFGRACIFNRILATMREQKQGFFQ